MKPPGWPGAARARRDEWLVGGLLAGLAFVLAAGAWTWRADRVLYDFGLSWFERPVPADIVIVAIDDASIAAIGRWPWPRAVHATALHRLAAARPKAVALDLLLSEPDADPAQDRLLAEAMRAAAPLVLPVSWQSRRGERLQVLEPAEPLRSASLQGAAEPTVDEDGVLRHAFLRAGPPGQSLPHMALALLEAGGESVHRDVAVVAAPAAATRTADAGTRDGRFLLRYTGPPGHVARVSYLELLQGQVPAERLAGRYVLVGMTAQGLGDTLATPVNAAQVAMPGVEVLANALYTLRSGDSIRALPPVAAGLLSAGLVGLLVGGFGWAGTRLAFGLALASVPLTVLASLGLLALGVWWSAVPYVLAAALAYPLWSWRRLERAVDDLDQEIRRLDLATPDSPAAAALQPRRNRDRLASRVAMLGLAAATVRDARRFLADALAGMPTAMLVVDTRGRVLLGNGLAARLFDLDEARALQGLDLPGLLEEFVTPQPIDWVQAFADPLARPEGWSVDARLARLGDFVIRVAAVDMTGRQRWIVTFADVTPIMQAQRRRDETLAFVSHDLRSPAHAIAMLADLHLQGRLDTPRDELLVEMRRLAGRTLQLSEDFVRVAQAEGRPLQPSRVDIRGLVDEVLADFRAQAASSQVRLEVLLPTGPAWWLDAALVARALGNLLSNALKHSPPGGCVTVSGEVAADGLRLSIQDQGPGLTPAQFQQIAQGDRGLVAVDAGGVGFGLLFVQRVAGRHAGRLQARAAAQGVGAVFELTLGRIDPAETTPG